MAKVIDFDRKFMDYADGWLALHPNLTPRQAEQSYNQIMTDWLNAPAKWLGGATPGEYFNKFTDPDELVAMVRQYDLSDVGLPEPLYRRIVALGEASVPALMGAIRSKKNKQTFKETLMGMLLDIDSDTCVPLCVELVTKQDEPNELMEMSAEILNRKGAGVVGELLDAYEAAAPFAKLMILEICCKFPGDERILTYCVQQLETNHDYLALIASFLNDLGDARAIEPLRKVMSLSEVGYLDYIELKNAIESLGGEVGDERTFDGDPDYEAMKYMK